MTEGVTLHSSSSSTARVVAARRNTIFVSLDKYILVNTRECERTESDKTHIEAPFLSGVYSSSAGFEGTKLKSSHMRTGWAGPDSSGWLLLLEGVVCPTTNNPRLLIPTGRKLTSRRMPSPATLSPPSYRAMTNLPLLQVLGLLRAISLNLNSVTRPRTTESEPWLQDAIKSFGSSAKAAWGRSTWRRTGSSTVRWH